MKTLYLIDSDSNLTRTYMKSCSVVDESNLREDEMFLGLPFFYVENAIGNVFNSIKTLNSLLGAPYDYIAISLDPYGPCAYRTNLDSNYKGNRPPKTAGFLLQKLIFSEYMSSLGFAVVNAGDYESDDVFATFVKKISDLGMPIFTYIHSRDKDLYQLISDQTYLFDGTDVINREKCLEKFSLPPEKIGDYLAMIGDTADGIQGVSGCGATSAVQLLQKHTLKEITENPQVVNDMGLRTRKSIIKGLSDPEYVELQKKLVSLVDNVDLGIHSFKSLARTYNQDSISIRDFVELRYARYKKCYEILLERQKTKAA